MRFIKKLFWVLALILAVIILVLLPLATAEINIRLSEFMTMTKDGFHASIVLLWVVFLVAAVLAFLKLVEE